MEKLRFDKAEANPEFTGGGRFLTNLGRGNTADF